MTVRNDYRAFLETKVERAAESGIRVSADALHPALKPHQRDAVIWALQGGRRALFEAFGLGKTVQELEWCRILTEETGGRALIVLPLGVKQEFTRDAANILGMAPPPYVRTMAEVDAADGGIVMTNYERVRDGDIDPKKFVAAGSLDEAAVLRSFGSKTYQEFTQLFKGVPYKLVCTAVPSPNRYKELIHYAGFLEVMDTGQALTRFFKRDPKKAGNLRLMESMEQEFWLWVSSWALFITRPSDIGHSDEGYDLPPLDVRKHKIDADYTPKSDRDGQLKLFRETSSSLPAAASEKRESIEPRVAKAVEIIEEEPGAHYILWHDLEDERREIKRQLPEAVEIFGSQDIDERERRVIAFSEGETQILATKKSLSGSGCNFQHHCHRAIFVGVDHKFHDFIQAVHRIYRFLQPERVRVDIIYTEAEGEILQNLMQKWKRHDEMAEKMRDIMEKYGIGGNVFAKLGRKLGVERVVVRGERFTAVNNDCVEELKTMESDSIGLIHTSIPFSNHYEYTPSYNDFGHNRDTARFFEQMDFLSPEMLRVLKPGRVFACHVKDRVQFGRVTGTGMPTIEPFHALCIDHYMRHGFQYFGMITVVTDVVSENNQTYRLGWSEQCRDGTKMGVGCPEYILLFRKLPSDTSTAYADEPVEKSKEEYTRAQWQLDAHGYWRSSGDRMLTKDELLRMPTGGLQKAYRTYSRGSVYSYEEHVELAKSLDEDGRLPASFMVVAPASLSPDVWDDISRIRTLNMDQSRKNETLHVCPLQLDIVERIVRRYSNPGDTVLDPFGGLMTVPLVALKMGRLGYGVELNPDYFRDGVGYLQAEEAAQDMPTLFDFLEEAK